MNTNAIAFGLLLAIGPVTAGLFLLTYRAIRAIRARREARERARARINALALKRRLRLI